MKKSLKLFAIFTLIATFVAGLIAPFTAKAAEKIDTSRLVSCRHVTQTKS